MLSLTYLIQMSNLLVDDEDDSIFPEDGGRLKMAIGATNTRKKMVYSRKVFAMLTVIFFVYATGEKTEKYSLLTNKTFQK